MPVLNNPLNASSIVGGGLINRDNKVLDFLNREKVSPEKVQSSMESWALKTQNGKDKTKQNRNLNSRSGK
jgi:hypothetical protein